MTYYDTTKVDPKTRQIYAAKGSAQEDLILAFYKKHSGQRFMPSHVWIRAFNKSVPITSVRRAMNTLTAKELLKKTDRTAIGHYGRPEHLWELKQ